MASYADDQQLQCENKAEWTDMCHCHCLSLSLPIRCGLYIFAPIFISAWFHLRGSTVVTASRVNLVRTTVLSLQAWRTLLCWSNAAAYINTLKGLTQSQGSMWCTWHACSP